jgi:L-ascorbate metabolism protein UlaG (beta-lactamase superfamily)
MVISYLGGEFFKLQFGDLTVACNPISKDSKLKSSRFGADVALVSVLHPDFSGTEQLEFGEKKPFVISGPGEYEIKDIFVRGFLSPSKYDGKDRVNTIYYLTMDGMRICFLGALSSFDVDAETKEALEDIDILFVPVGGEGVLTGAEAYKLAVSLEPRVIIPMHYGEMGAKDALKAFLKESGSEKVEALDKFTVKRKDIEGKNSEVVVLSSL